MNVGVEVGDLLLQHLLGLFSTRLDLHLDLCRLVALVTAEGDVIDVELGQLRFKSLQLNAVFAEHLATLVNQIIRLHGPVEDHGPYLVKGCVDFLLALEHLQVSVAVTDYRADVARVGVTARVPSDLHIIFHPSCKAFILRQ